MTLRGIQPAYAISLLVILTLLVASLGVVYFLSAREIEERAWELERAVFDEAVRETEGRVELVDLVLMSVLRSVPVIEFFQNTHETNASMLLNTFQLQDTLRTVFSAAPGWVSVAIVSYEQERVVTEGGVTPLDEFWDREALSDLRFTGASGGFLGARPVELPLREGAWRGDVITILRGFPLGSPVLLRDAGAIVYIDAAAVTEPWIERSSRSDLVVTLYDDGGRSIPSSDSAGQPVASLRPTDASDGLLGSGEQRGSALSMAATGRRTGWRYEAVLEEASVGSFLTGFRRGFVVIAVSALALGAIAVTILDRYTRRPLEQTIRHISERVHQLDVGSGDADLRSIETVEQQVRAIVERSLSLQSQVRLSLPALRWQLLMERLLSPSASSGSELTAGVGVVLPGPLFTVLLFRPAPQPSRTTNIESATLVSAIEPAIRPLWPIEMVTLLDGSTAAILSSRIKPNRETMLHAIEKALAVVPGCVAAVGRTCDGEAAIHRSFVSAGQALEYQILDPGNTIYECDRRPAAGRDRLPGTIAGALRDVPPLLRRRRGTRLHAWVEEYLDLAQSQSTSPTQFKHAVVSLIFELRAGLRRSKCSTHFLDAEAMAHEVWNSMSLSAVRGLAVASAERAHKVLAAEPHGAGNELSHQLAAFVDSHYADPSLSLGYVADAFKISPTYVSRLFSEQIGQPFHEFVTAHRLRSAARSLVESDARVASIASAVGYTEVRTFIRAFKRSHGSTPLEYRRANLTTVEGSSS